MLRLSLPNLRDGAIRAAIEVLRSGQLVHGDEGAAFEAELSAAGRSPAEAFGVIAALRGPTGALKARIHEKERGVATARLDLWLDQKTVIPAYPDRDGWIELGRDVQP